MCKRPFIKKIKTDRFHYIYDVNSNELIKVSPLMYDIIEESAEVNRDSLVERFKGVYGKDEIIKNLEAIQGVKKEHNYFSGHRPEIFSGVGSIDDVRYILDSNLEQLILEVTEQCNLRCKYCSFSGRYKHARVHSGKKMAVEVMERAVDFFIGKCDKSNQAKLPAITFYGGEPLLRTDLIKRAVELTRKKGLFEQFSFSLTTNGTLLPDDIITYFIHNHISMLISLDGPKEVHDRYRFFSNGQGAFDSILKNLERIQRINPSYFESCISFNVVAAPPYDFELLIDFFHGQPFFEPFAEKIRLNFVDAFETTFFNDFCLEADKEKNSKELSKLRERHEHALINGTYDELTLEKRLFLEDFHTIACRRIERMGNRYPPIGSCFPGQRRLMVDAQGNFFMCEKVGQYFEIGNIYNGFNYSKIYDFIMQYDKFFEGCGDCWAVRLCKKCFNSVRKGERFDIRRKEALCKTMQTRIEKNLIAFCGIVEKNPDAFKVFDGITVT
jgi:uncharacterized protein